jgi:hypothetical protein
MPHSRHSGELFDLSVLVSYSCALVSFSLEKNVVIWTSNAGIHIARKRNLLSVEAASLVMTSGKTGGLKTVNRSKRIKIGAT